LAKSEYSKNPKAPHLKSPPDIEFFEWHYYSPLWPDLANKQQMYFLNKYRIFLKQKKYNIVSAMMPIFHIYLFYCDL